jgi:hypothetical protein
MNGLLKKDKVCTKCKKLKPRNEFYPLRNYVTSECKECMKERAELFRKNNIELYRKSKKVYRDKDPERWNNYARDYQKEHAERICLAIKIRWHLKKIKTLYGIDLGKFSVRNKTDKELQKYHKYLKEFKGGKTCCNTLN